MEIKEKFLGLLSAGLIPESELQDIINKYDTVIRVDRSVTPAYPDWKKQVMHPELELAGPAEFDVTKLEPWFHPDQSGGVSGNAIYEKLKVDNLLKGCFNLADLLAIQARGIAFYRQHFAGKYLPAWGSVVQDSDDGLGVPYLYGRGGEVELGWRWLGFDFGSDDPAWRRAS